MMKMRRQRWYVLRNQQAVEVPTMMQWAREFQNADRRVARTEVGKDVAVSTVFLGIDHRIWGEGKPLLFETLIFGGEHDGAMWRTSTWDEAKATHDEALALIWGKGANARRN